MREATAHSPDAEATFEDERRTLLVGRVRVAAWATIATALIFAVGDLFLATEWILQRYALKVPQILGQIGVLLALRTTWGRRHVQGLALLSIGVIGISVATGAAVIENTTIPPLQLTGVAVVTAVFFPWGTTPQAITVAILCASILWNLALVGAPVGYGALGATVFLLWSIYFARTMGRERRALFEARVALIAKNRELEEADRRKSEFLATISHDLRTPLNVILGYCEMLTEEAVGPINAAQRELLSAIHRYSRLQLDMVSDVLDFSRLTADGVSVRRERFAVEPMLIELQQQYAPLAAKGVRIGVEVSSDLTSIDTDRVKLHVALRNLVDNAVKYTERGSIRLRARGTETPGRVCLEVEDTGIGIPASELPQIFVAFRQGAQPSKAGTMGVGLGLAIVKQLVDVLGGSIEVRSTVGQGTCFRIEVPADGRGSDR